MLRAELLTEKYPCLCTSRTSITDEMAKNINNGIMAYYKINDHQSNTSPCHRTHHVHPFFKTNVLKSSKTNVLNFTEDCYSGGGGGGGCVAQLAGRLA
jgi:hypothetical protein